MASRRTIPASYLATEPTDASTAKWLEGVRLSSRHRAVLRRLFAGEDVNVTEPNGVRALHIAARFGAIDQLRHLLEDGADPSLRTVFGRSPLDYAHRFRQLEIVRFLVVHDALVEELTTELLRSPTLDELYLAMHDDAFRCFRNDVETRVRSRGARLIAAARRDDFEVVRAMLESKEASVNDVLHSTGETAFSAALSAGRYEMCEYLLACGAHMHAPCIVDGRALSTLAGARGAEDKAFVKRLVARDPGRSTPPRCVQMCALLEAISRSSTAMLDALLELQEPIYIIGLTEELSMPPFAAGLLKNLVSCKPKCWLVLGIACWLQDVRLVEHLLATRPALQNQTELAKNGASALLLAVYQQNEDIVIALLRKGVPISQRVNDDLSALMAAVEIDSVRMLDFLLVHRADLSSMVETTRGGYDTSLLEFAVRSGATQCARALLPRETRLKHRDKTLIAAVERNDFEFAQLLVDEGAPSSDEASISCVKQSSCAVMLDLILSRCCSPTFSFSTLESNCRLILELILDPDVGSVLLAHGFDVMYNRVVERAFGASPRGIAVLQSHGFPIARIQEGSDDI